jgi:hypothetical protein
MTPGTKLCALMLLAVLGVTACAGGGQPTEKPDRPEPTYRYMNR